MMELVGSEVNPAFRSDPNGLPGVNNAWSVDKCRKHDVCVSCSSKQRNGNKLSARKIRLIAAIGASTAVAVSAVAVGVNQDSSSLGTDAQSGMPSGPTVTESIAPTTLPVTEAPPGIRGPVPLPPEEQGLPG